MRFIDHHSVEFIDPRSVHLRHLRGQSRFSAYASQVGNGITIQLVQPGSNGEQCQITVNPEVALKIIDAIHAALKDNMEVPHEGNSGLW